MEKTLVIQSYRTADVPPWVETCLASVRDWAAGRGFGYRFFGDELLDRVPDWYSERAAGRLPVITDIGRLLVAREALETDAGAVIWVDADVVVFDGDRFKPDIDADFAFSRELWLQPDDSGRLRVFRNVHNAVCMFRHGNAILDFYIDACERIMRRVEGGVPNQIVGTKFLTALHNMIGFPLIDDAGMASPRVLCDIAEGTGPALGRLVHESPEPLKALNLCGSLVGQTVDGVEVTAILLDRVCARLARDGRSIFGKRDVNG